MPSAELTARPTGSPWRAWLALARVSNTPTVVSDCVAGAVLASTVAAADVVALVTLASALFYTAGMILNDLLDEAIDRRERPERPLPSGQVSRQAALGAVIALFAAGAALLAVVGLAPFLAGLGLIALIVLYDAWHKGNVLSPALMAGCRVLVYVVAALAISAKLPGALPGAAALLFAYMVGLTQLAKAESGGIAARWPVLAVLAPAVYWAKELPAAEVALVLGVFVAWSGWALWLALARHRVGPAIGRLIAGIALYDALVAAGSGASAAAIAICLAAFAATVALQTKIAGT
jgi:4-hydroxybenzoate polyprenyltransferase